MNTFVVDTHTLVWFLSGDQRLSDVVRNHLRHPEVQLIIPTIVLAEIKHLNSKERIHYPLDDVLQIIGNDARVFTPLNPPVNGGK